jgi:hypothetical protein
MEKTQLLISVFQKILKNKKNISVSQIYGEMYNTGMFKDFILKIGVSSYDIIIAAYALYYMLTDSNLSVLDAINKAVYSIFLVISVEIEDKVTNIEDCDRCGGDGTLECDNCEGVGQVNCGECGGEGTDDEDKECSECAGGGYESCRDCVGNETVECEDCYGQGTVDGDGYEITYNKEYWLVSNPEVITQFKMRDENAYFNTDDFEELIDVDNTTSLYLGYVRNSIQMEDFISENELDVDDVDYRDNFFLKIEEVYPSILLTRLVGRNKFGKMI